MTILALPSFPQSEYSLVDVRNTKAELPLHRQSLEPMQISGLNAEPIASLSQATLARLPRARSTRRSFR